jgi:hypothetical protein
MLCPRAPAVPKNTVGTPSVLSGLRSMVGAQAHGQCASLLSVLTGHGQSSQAMVSPQTHCRYPKRMVGIPTHRQCPGAWSVPRPMVRARCMVRVPAHGRCPGPWSVLRPMVSAPAHGRCSGPWSVPTVHGRYPGSKTADRRPAPRSTLPNKALELTGKKLALFPSSSPPAFGIHLVVIPSSTEGWYTGATTITFTPGREMGPCMRCKRLRSS